MDENTHPTQAEPAPLHHDHTPDDHTTTAPPADKPWTATPVDADRPRTALQDTSPNTAEPSPVPPAAPSAAGETVETGETSEPPETAAPPEPGPDNTTLLDRVHLFDAEADDSFPDDQPFLHDTLPEAESSFVAPLSPLPTISQDGPDDTYLFDSPRKPTPPPAPSSPLLVVTAAAAAAAPAPADPVEPADDTPSRGSRNNGSRALDLQNAPSLDPPGLTGGGDVSLTSDDAAAADVRRPGLRYGKRPRFLRSRNASQRSSASSFTASTDTHEAHDALETHEARDDDAGSDVTVGLNTDYALQSGGAMPAAGGGRGRQASLARTVSLGSVASTVDQRLDGGGSGSGSGSDALLLQTPRPGRTAATLAPPTDTVLARRVMDVQVPEALANEYRVQGGLATPRRPDFAAASSATSASVRRPGRSNMTLKEQSSTIERLSKENFDLKLKVMFLSDRLDKLSEDSVKEMIQENVEFRTSIAILQRDNKALRRRVKDFERRGRDEEEPHARPETAKSAESAADAAQDREDELLFLRKRVEDYTATIDRFRQDLLHKEAEKRQMAGMVKSLQTAAAAGSAAGVGPDDAAGHHRQDEEDVWKDLLEQETARREQADEDNRRLREEVFRLRQEFHQGPAASSSVSKRSTAGPTALSSTTVLSRDNGGGEADADAGADPSVTSGTHTLVEELRRESEQLRHENAELRKEVGAQTSMLTSRNREKERLYQEIEDLKMAQRRGGGPAPSTIDSFLDHSASQVGVGRRERGGGGGERGERERARSGSRSLGGGGGGGAETVLGVDEDEREDLENRNASLRDKINEARLANQELLQELEAALQQKQEVEATALGVQQDYEVAMADLLAMQAERDELVAELNEGEQKQAALQQAFDELQAEAQEAIDGYEDEADVREAELGRAQAALAEQTENFAALQDEMRKLSEALVGLEDETAGQGRRVRQLEQELAEANKELEELEAKLREANDKAQRLLVQQENSQGEIAFLREEQESDKIALSRLEAALSKAEEALRDEQERVRQGQQQLVAERERSESLATKDKKEMQHVVNDLSREAAAAKEEARRLRKSLTSREVEATEWKERLMELESNLREALGDLSGTRSGLLKAIAKLQRELENTVRELDATKAALADKDRLVKQRDALLESHGLEARKTAEALDKERAAHHHTRHQFETFQKTHQHVTRTMSTQDARISELELTKTQDKRRLAQLEASLRDQLHERNTLLLLLWTRLSAVCGLDWAHDHSLVSGRALPSLEVVATMLPGFTRNLLAAVQHIETAVGGFPARLKAVEAALWRDYQNLEAGLDARVKKLDRLEGVVRNLVAAGGAGGGAADTRLLRLEEAYRQLKVENATLRTANEVRARAAYGGATSASTDLDFVAGSPAPSIPTGPRDRSSRASTLRSKSSAGRGPGSGGGLLPRPSTAHHGSGAATLRTALSAGELVEGEAAVAASSSSTTAGSDTYNADPRWILRLRDLENKLKLEREGRTLDRNEAARRLREQEAELKWRGEREKRAS